MTPGADGPSDAAHAPGLPASGPASAPVAESAPPRRTLSVVPTALGRTVLVVAAVAVLLAWSGLGAGFGFVAAAGLAAWSVSAIVTWRRVRFLRIAGPGPSLATAREPFAAELAVTNDGARPVLDVVVSIVGAHGERVRDATLIPRLDARATIYAVVPAPALRRGRHPLGVASLQTAFPTGLAVGTVTFVVADEVVVVPRLGTVRDADVRVRGERAHVVSGSARRGEEQEVYGVRAWREGEGLRGVHWKLTARLGRLMVREFRGESRPAIHVALDLRVPKDLKGAHGAFEDAVSLSASLVEHAMRHENPVRLSIAGSDVSTIACGRGRGGIVPALAALADVAPVAGTADAAVVPGRAGERRFVVRAGDAGAGAPVLQGARVLDTTDPATAAVFSRNARGARQPFAARGCAADTSDDPRREIDAAARTTVIAACVVAVLATGATAIDVFARADWEVFGEGFASRVPALALLVAPIAQLGAVVRTRDAGRARRAAWTSPLLALGAAAQAPTWGTIAGVVLTIAALQVALALHAGSDARRRVGRAPDGPPEARPVGSRVRAGLALVVPTALVAALLLPVTTWTPAPSDSSLLRHGRGRGSSGSGDGIVVDPSGAAGDLALVERAVLVRIVPTRDGKNTGNLGPMYLRGLTLPEVGPDGSWFESSDLPPRVRDADDGRTDGWCTLSPLAGARGLVEYEIEQSPLEHSQTGLPMLHVPIGAAAIRAATVRHEADGVVLAARPSTSVDPFGVRAPEPARLPLPGDSTRAVAPEVGHLGFPTDCPIADVLAAEARRVAAGAETDLAKVRAIVRHLRTAYAYRGVGRGLDESAALEVFHAQQAGTCVQFAEASALMLRSLGVPSRVATGFLVKEWDERNERYLGRGRDYHAWVEVPFEGCGWVVFEPTPAATADQDRASADPDDDAVLGSRRLGEILRGTGLGTSGAAAIGWIVSVILVAVALAALARRRARRFAEAEPGSSAGFTGLGPWERLLAALSRRGHVRRRTQTATEFATAVVAAEGAGFDRLATLTARQQAARFGAHPLASDDLREIDRFREEL